ncbi:esterase [Nocardia amamiensis]|uniref:Esterase n=1 Tax=Nocardia amamiensis TaxID=404578 RepID=A0ABS0CWA3_9NOCA|nr:esterase [Nocardia amamiensis]MBF6300765.1 esterase [Nocardia amamiensis]
MHHFARRTAGFTAVLAAAGLVVAGCGDDEDADTAATTTTWMTTIASPTTTTAATATDDEDRNTTGTPGAAAEETRIMTPAGEITVSGDIYDKYIQSGGPTGPLGLPLQAQEDGPDEGDFQDFVGGTIAEAKDSEPYVVWGEIRKAWEENGGPGGRLGYPISDEKDIPGGKQSDFTGGTITWVDGTITVTPKS